MLFNQLNYELLHIMCDICLCLKVFIHAIHI